LLFAVERLDGGVDVEDPGGVEQGGDAVAEMLIQPGHAFGFRDGDQCAAQGIFGDDFVHAQEAGIDAVATDGGDVGVAFVAGEDRQHPGAEDIGKAGGIGTGVG